MKQNAQYNPCGFSSSQLWCLGLGAIQQAQNGAPQDLIGHEQADEVEIASVKQALQRDWDINHKNSLLETLEWLRASGHNRGYLAQQRKLEQMSVAGIEAYIDSFADQKEANQVRVVANYRHVLGRGGVAAWDIGRYVWIARSGRMVRWLDDEEMWALLQDVAPACQPLFRSWYDYGVSYIAGRQYWRGVVTADAAERDSRTLQGVTGNPHSAWNRLDWNLSLVF